MAVSRETPTVAEFFAGVGLVRMALERVGCRVTFANDISPVKQRMYAENFSGQDFVLADIRDLTGADIPTVDVATASFPCTDVSLAGTRAGLQGRESSLLGDFLRILGEMGDRRPESLLIENVSGFATSNGGADVLRTLRRLSDLGYFCDVVALDARRFVPQSRPRLFFLCTLTPPQAGPDAANSTASPRPRWAARLFDRNPWIRSYAAPLPPLPEQTSETLEDVLEPFEPDDPIWWRDERTESFIESLSDINESRAKAMRESASNTHATAYRRTRRGKAVWEIRGDRISGCLRTTRGGSSRQAVVEGVDGQLRVRWMTAREYARLQGAPEFKWGDASDVQARFALGDAVCVPAVAWLMHHFLNPIPMDEHETLREGRAKIAAATG